MHPIETPCSVYRCSGIRHDRAEAIAEFEKDAKNDPALLQAIKDLPEDAVLGCWCKPANKCHGDVILVLWKELHKIV